MCLFADTPTPAILIPCPNKTRNTKLKDIQQLPIVFTYQRYKKITFYGSGQFAYQFFIGCRLIITRVKKLKKSSRKYIVNMYL